MTAPMSVPGVRGQLAEVVRDAVRSRRLRSSVMTWGACRGTHVVFAGPSLGTATIDVPGIRFRGPIARGALSDLPDKGICSIAIIDGLFDERFSVGHREIDDALRRGIAVHGSSSMGALRAVEMREHGMIGHGWIFRRFLVGAENIGDDEVALIHDPEPPYRTFSDPLVNIAYALEILIEVGGLTATTAEELQARQHDLFYPQRSFTRLAADYTRMCRRAEADDVARLLRHGREHFDVKRYDALDLLLSLAKHASTPGASTWAGFHGVCTPDVLSDRSAAIR